MIEKPVDAAGSAASMMAGSSSREVRDESTRLFDRGERQCMLLVHAERLVATIDGAKEATVRATTDATIDLSGVIRSDLRRNRVHSLRLCAPIRVESEVESKVESDVTTAERRYGDWYGEWSRALDVENEK